MVRKLYKSYARPLVRVVTGSPISWEPTVATMKHSGNVLTAAWSPCSRFIAVGFFTRIEILDAVTLERLHTFTHPMMEKTRWFSFSPDSRSLTQFSRDNCRLTTWDLQTGGQISATPSAPNTSSSQFFSSAYSVDGKAVAVVGYRYSGNSKFTVISTYNLLSGTHICSRVPEGRIVASIWTHGEFLRFITVKPGSITIWEFGFTPEHTLAEIESLSVPGEIGSGECLFLPTRSRLAFILGEAVFVWDSRDSEFLLGFVGDDRPRGLSFSLDGGFFSCGTIGQGIHLWKETPTGYVLHRKLIFKADTTPLLSPDGESIITSSNSDTQLWRTTDPISPPSSVPTQPDRKTDFVLAFSPDKSFIAIGRYGDNIATIFDLKSGDPRLIVDTGMKICSLGVTGNTVIAVGDRKVVTWDLPAGDRVLDARANIHDSIRTIVVNHPLPPLGYLHSASISPDFNHLVISRGVDKGLDIYDMSTGKYVVGSATDFVSKPWFTRDGRELRYPGLFYHGEKIIRGGGSDIIGLEPVQYGSAPSGGYLWESSHGHNVADDGWILDSRNKRVMWLPNRWRVSKENRVWDGRFLALFDPRLPEPVVIEMDE